MKTKLLYVVLSLFVLVLASCGPAPDGPAPCSPIDGYTCVHSATGKWMYIAAGAMLTNSMQWFPASAQIEGAVSVYTLDAGTLILQGVLLPAAMVVNPNLIQNLVEGLPTLQVGDQLLVAQQDGSVMTIQLVTQDVTVPEVNALDKESIEGRDIMKRIAVVIEDDVGWQNILREVLQSSGFVVQVCATFCDSPDAQLIVVDAQDPAEQVVGPGFVRTLRMNHPQAVIIGVSSNLDWVQPGAQVTVEVQFMMAGATAVWNKMSTLETLFSLLPK